MACLLYTSDAADERSSVDLGGRRIIKKKKKEENRGDRLVDNEVSKTHTEVDGSKRGEYIGPCHDGMRKNRKHR